MFLRPGEIPRNASVTHHDDLNQRYETVWIELQEELASRSSRGEVRVASGAGHLIHHEKPQLVVEAIGDVIVRARRLV